MVKLNKDRYVVTGGAGFIGSHIAEEIVKQGKHVTVIDNLSGGTVDNFDSWWDDKLCTFVEMSVTAPRKELFPIFEDADIVFHEACSKCTECFSSPYQDLMVNAWGSWNIFEVSRQMGVKKVIHASTGSVMDGNPVSFYGVSKLAGEKYLGAFKDYYPDFNYTALRYYNVYGTRQNDSEFGGVVPIFINRILKNKPIKIYGSGNQMRRFTNVKDVVNANFIVAESKKTNSMTLNVVSNVHISILRLANLLYELMDKRPDIQFDSRRHGDIDDFKVDAKKSKCFGIECNIEFVEGLQETINWYKRAI